MNKSHYESLMADAEFRKAMASEALKTAATTEHLSQERSNIVTPTRERQTR